MAGTTSPWHSGIGRPEITRSGQSSTGEAMPRRTRAGRQPQAEDGGEATSSGEVSLRDSSDGFAVCRATTLNSSGR